MYIFHKRIVGEMEKVHKARSAFKSAHRVLEERPEIFGESPKKSTSLLATLNKVAPGQYFWSIADGDGKGYTEDRKILESCGGMAEVARNAKHAKDSIPELEKLLDKEAALFSARFSELKSNEKANRKRKYLSGFGLLSSLAVFCYSAYTINAYCTSGQENKVALAGAILGSIVSLIAASFTFSRLDKYVKASCDCVQEAIGRMKGSLGELKQSLEEIVYNVPFRF